ncbi:MAG: amidohydrolase family protein [Acidobacteria bacterium]|nr:amidohydrolase family protein [Acidobacteriota bacterium]MYA46430.1 amidohydrolase family protein [Acidobacteriota bacterium]MYI38331.1 amidohydrolase family protein [Acidobacteriota bacterium]
MVHAHCYRQDEILQLLRVAEEFGVRIATLQHVLEGYKVANEIAAHGAGASTFSDWWAYKVEAYDAIPHNAALMTERGILVSINSDSAEEARHLNQEAAKTVKWGGMSEEEALKMITINAAIHLGIDDKVGSIEAGKDADLAIFDRHPLSTYAVNQMTFVDGEMLFSRERDLAMREAMAAERTELEAKLSEGADAGRGPGGRGGPRRGPREGVRR